MAQKDRFYSPYSVIVSCPFQNGTHLRPYHTTTTEHTHTHTHTHTQRTHTHNAHTMHTHNAHNARNTHIGRERSGSVVCATAGTARLHKQAEQRGRRVAPHKARLVRKVVRQYDTGVAAERPPVANDRETIHPQPQPFLYERNGPVSQSNSLRLSRACLGN